MASERPVAIVTGASRGIGHHLAVGLAAAGYRVVGCSRHGSPGGQGIGPIAAVDVCDGCAVADFVDEVARSQDHVDVLVNAAGMIEDETALWEANPEQWWRVVEVNVRGPFLMCHAVVPHLLAGGGGRVINLSSGAGYASRPDLTAYCASKSALARITGGVHLAGYGRGVRAFDVAPGVVATDMTAGMRSHRDRTEWTDPALVVEMVTALAGGDLDAWSGRLVRVGVDTPASLKARARTELADTARTLGLVGWGVDDPLG